MNIWSILQISPTTDKKLIRKAYAKLSKDYHPEEKPEEFKLLYDAYQAAMEYANMRTRAMADVISHQKVFPDGAAEQALDELSEHGQSPAKSHTETPIKNDELYKAFQETKAFHRDFISKWDTFFYHGHRQETSQLFADYLNSEEFQKIRLNPQVIGQIIDSFEHEWRPHQELYYPLWDFYRFYETNQNSYIGPLLDLYKCLAKKIDSWEKEGLRKQLQAEQERRTARRWQIIRSIAMVTIPLFVVTVTLILYHSNVSELLGS